MPLFPEQSELGKKSAYDASYCPDKLFAIARKDKRDEIGVSLPLPFYGFDLWHHYEVSWLNPRGKPVVAVARISYSCETPAIIESKSMKLYFNSFNNTIFENVNAVEKAIIQDISSRVGGDVFVEVMPLNEVKDQVIFAKLPGICLDDLDIACTQYEIDTSTLKVGTFVVEETLFSNLLKSNCLVTFQPDWGSVQIHYVGKQIDHAGLLQYLVSFRNHNEFHEQCIERIFVDIMKYCQPQKLTVYGRYTRRGGVDINPYRSTESDLSNIPNLRLCRQ